MSTFAPAECRVRAISAPTRRAPPVMSTTWSRKLELSMDSMSKHDTATQLQREITLNEAQAQHAAAVRDHLAQQIAASGGWLSFERFMESALYAPGLGYYSAGARKLGAGGDFTTAPEVSHLFGGCVARQCAQILTAVREGSI